jgi:hypothetical protein
MWAHFFLAPVLAVSPLSKIWHKYPVTQEALTRFRCSPCFMWAHFFLAPVLAVSPLPKIWHRHHSPAVYQAMLIYYSLTSFKHHSPLTGNTAEGLWLFGSLVFLIPITSNVYTYVWSVKHRLIMKLIV